jgi:hypothetical protein
MALDSGGSEMQAIKKVHVSEGVGKIVNLLKRSFNILRIDFQEFFLVDLHTVLLLCTLPV